MFAVALPALLGAGAMALDLGMIYLQRRTLQTATDAAAMAAASKPETASASVRSLLDAYGLQTATYAITYGTYDDTAGIDRDHRFTPGPQNNGVRIEATMKSPVFFARIFSMETTELTVRSEAAMAPIVSLSAGSRLASVGPSALNDILNGLLGLNLNLKVADYNSLVSTNIQLGPLLNAIVNEGLVRNVTDILAEDVLSQPIKLSVLLSLLSKQVDATGDLVAGSVLRKAAQNTLSADVMVVLGDILQLGNGIGKVALAYPGAALQTNLSVLGLLNAAIGQNGIGTALKTGLEVPNVLSTTAEVLVGESGKTAKALSISDALPAISTDQVRLRLQVKTEGLLNALGVAVNVPIEIVAAGGTAKVVSVTCDSDPAKREIKVEAQPGVVRLSIGKFVGSLKSAGVNDQLEAVELVKLPLVSVLGQANIAAKQDTPITLVFKGKEIGNGTTKTAKTTTIIQSLVKTLLTKTKLSVKVLGLVLNLDDLLAAVGNILGELTKPLDDLLNGVLAAVGVSLGELDVRVDDLVCGNPKIVG